MAAVFEFTRQGRSPRTVAILIALYTGLIGAIILIDAAWWLMTALALLSLPALWDLWRDPSAGVRLSADRLEWHTGRRRATLELQEIEHMRFDTRWDFSVRVTAVLQDGKQARLPYESLPPHRNFEKALVSKGVTVKRHHFKVF
jgi:hypothetical protein